MDAVNRTINPDTQQALQALSHECDSLRKTAKVLGVPHSVLADILAGRSGHVSLHAENRVRAALGLPPLPAPVLIPPCPDCGSAHHTRCNGNSGPVVVLAATERIVGRGKPRNRRRYHRPVATPEQEARRVALGVEWRKVVEAGLNALEGEAR